MPPKHSALGAVHDKLVSQYGARVAAVPSDPVSGPLYEVLSSGSLTIDYALRLGGFIRGRIHELVGSPDCAKTTIMINAMAAAQRAFTGQLVGYVDVEKIFDDYWATLNGLDLRSRFEHVYADDAEDASDQARLLVRDGSCSLVVVDSIGGMESRKALEKDAAEKDMGSNAQVITRMCKALASDTRRTGTTVVLVNQLRAVLGSMASDVSAGPKPMQHATTTRVQMGRGKEEPVKLKMEEGMDPEVVCNQFKARVTRSKAFPPGRIATFWVNNRDTEEFGAAGLNRPDEYITMGVRLGAIQQDGSWYTIPGLPKIQGRTGAARQLRGHPEVYEAMRGLIFREERDGSR